MRSRRSKPESHNAHTWAPTSAQVTTRLPSAAVRRAVAWSLVGLTSLCTGTARAQDAASRAAADEGLEQVVVSGTRIARPGFDAPTPTTTIGVEEIQRAAPANIADFVNELPQLSASATPRVGNANTSTGFNGLNNLNLRALGSNRTLVLLDGQRVIASALNGAVDINNLPSALVERVDVVTGGASAAYGSDAVSGVVNFILNKNFTGFKANVSGGITDRSDDRTTNADVSFGKAFADGKGHFLFSGEYGRVGGIDYLDPEKRRWFRSVDMLTFASSVRPQRIVVENVNTRTVAQGGVITSTALQNTQFGVGGKPLPFILGSPTDTFFMVGGNTWYEGNAVALDSKIQRQTYWTRTSYDFTDNVFASLEGSYATSHTGNSAAYQRYPGAGSTALIMSASNPFLDASVAARAATLGITQFNYGWSAYDFGRPDNDVKRSTYRGVARLGGSFGNTWQWDSYYQYGRTDLDVALLNTTNKANFAKAIDAVRDPATGRIVCRSTLSVPTDGCVPLNIFGIGVADPAAIGYVQGVATQDLTLREDVAAASMTGEPFDIWAGPVSTAFGAEYRKEEITGTADPVSIANGFFTGNFKPTVGSYNVKEAFFETVVPLAKDITAIKSLEFNGAARYTDYSLSGNVTTWKLGLTYSPFSDLRFRGVRSRDIRAANVGELFQAGQTQRQDVVDTSVPTRPSLSITRVTSGNTALTPEIAMTTSFGVAYSPSWLSQFTGSVDYYSIDITDAIATLGNQEIVDRCVAGETQVCSLVVRNAAGSITQILAIPINVAQQKTKGLDIEASWRQELGGFGKVTLRALASHINNLTTINGPVKTEAAGQNSAGVYNTPKWRWLGSVNYVVKNLSFNVTARGFNAGVYDNTWVSGINIDDNHIPGATYVDLSGSYRFDYAEDDSVEAYFKVENLMDKDPAVVAGANISALQTNPALYDVVGRNYRVGVRVRF
jgi:outer membrane receptor protein involved in Fe transport